MKRQHARVAVAVGTVAALGVGAAVAADDGRRGFSERLSGFEEVPAISTTGGGTFRAQVNRARTEITFEVRFSGLETNLTQSHIHFENATNNGPVVAFLCTNLGNGPAGTPACPDATSGEFEGTLGAVDVLEAGPDPQGLDAGEIDELIRALGAGATYVNLHSAGFPGGEIRGQIADHDHHDDD